MSDENTFKKLKKLSLARPSYSAHCRLVYLSLEPLQRERLEFSEWKKRENRAGSLVSCSSRSRSDRHVEVKTHVSTAQFDWRLDWLWSHGNTEQKRQRALSNNDDEITKQYSSAGWKLHTHTQLWGAEVLQPLFSRAPLTASAVSDGGGNRAAGRWRREGWRESARPAGPTLGSHTAAQWANASWMNFHLLATPSPVIIHWAAEDSASACVREAGPVNTDGLMTV